jgi:hypothetical protein
MRATLQTRSKAVSIWSTTRRMRWPWLHCDHGFRPSNRYIVFQVLPHTLGVGSEVWRVLAKGHEIRNVAEYEGELNIDERIVADMITACRIVAAKLN